MGIAKLPRLLYPLSYRMILEESSMRELLKTMACINMLFPCKNIIISFRRRLEVWGMELPTLCPRSM